MARRAERDGHGALETRPTSARTGHPGGTRRLIAGLRITRQDEDLLAVVRPYFTDAGSEGELAYRLWRRGLELTLAEVVGLGAALPPGVTENQIATLVAQRLLLSTPLLRQTGKLALLGIASAPPGSAPPTDDAPKPTDVIDTSASDTVVGLGGGDFL